ncbi:MAG: aminotransferase class III-fold pyridoxal phosphate-dependent enzyme [Gammaproteobacteria bacterium]|nr:aminotransferase class III-fold pyridoxal phosphate-dependent enzyme [Gammaproteobacteria bacterium]
MASARELGEVAARRMSAWEQKYPIVGQVRGLGLLLGVSFKIGEGEQDCYCARSVRDEMLKSGVWAICDREPQVRLYPALNMEKSVLLEGLEVMEAAIDTVSRKGTTVGDYPALPSGNVGF